MKILDGYDVCLNAPKIEENKVTRAIAAPAKKKETNIKSNLEEELTR